MAIPDCDDDNAHNCDHFDDHDGHGDDEDGYDDDQDDDKKKRYLAAVWNGVSPYWGKFASLGVLCNAS